jgi:hypothetical protein
MDSRPHLIQSSQDLHRKVYASLPWGFRLARALFQLREGSADSEAFGRATYGLFLLYGVTGMPPAPFTPKNTREISDARLKGYGRDFGRRAVGLAQLRLNGEADQVEEALSYVSLQLLSNSFKEGVYGKDLHEAERYVLGMVHHRALDQLRKEKKNPELPVEEVFDSGSWDELGDLIPEREQEAILRKLETQRSAPDLAQYFQLLLEGYNTNQIAQGQMLPVAKSQQALRRYQGLIKNVLRQHFQWAV